MPHFLCGMLVGRLSQDLFARPCSGLAMYEISYTLVHPPASTLAGSMKDRTSGFAVWDAKCGTPCVS